MGWRRGVAFVKGINIYGSRRISQEKMLELCRRVEDENLRIVKVVKTDNIIFEKRGIHYADVSSRLEKVLSGYFKEKIHVTSRSMKTLKLLAEMDY